MVNMLRVLVFFFFCILLGERKGLSLRIHYLFKDRKPGRWGKSVKGVRRAIGALNKDGNYNSGAAS